jgi:hypothetical protein
LRGFSPRKKASSSALRGSARVRLLIFKVYSGIDANGDRVAQAVDIDVDMHSSKKRFASL